MAVGAYWSAGTPALIPVASLQLTAMRGSEAQTAPVARELDLSFNDAAGASRFEVVDANGKAIWSGAPERSGSQLRAKIGKTLEPGGYFARAYSGSGEMLHEYQFRVAK